MPIQYQKLKIVDFLSASFKYFKMNIAFLQRRVNILAVNMYTFHDKVAFPMALTLLSI